MESIFTRAYTYRQREERNNLENYLIEIFAYCLESDRMFLDSFLRLLGVESEAEFKISTQSAYPDFGRPDLELESSNHAILIECKVDHEERQNQLDDYGSILEWKSKKTKALVYLTKYYQTKSFDKEGIQYLNVKWLEIAQLVNADNQQLTQQLAHFLTENKIAMDKDFNTSDLLALETIKDTISKMDEVLDSVKGYTEDYLGQMTNNASRNTWLSKGAYMNLVKCGTPHKFNIDIGFVWWSSEESIWLSVRLWIDSKSNSYNILLDTFKNTLKGWDDPIESGRGTVIGIYLNVNEIVATKDEHIPIMRDFLLENLGTLVELKKTNPQLFK